MEIRKIGRKVEFVNSCRGNRSGFVHESTLFLNGSEVANAKCQYINRTWECYTYQAVMQKCLSSYIEKLLDNAIYNFKYENNITRLTKSQKDKIVKDFEKQSKIKYLRNAYKQLEYSI